MNKTATALEELHEETFSKTVFGFWLYLMTDCLLFGTLFCTYAVLHNGTFGGPSSKEIFSLKIAFTETIILLLSSLTCGFTCLAAVKNQRKILINWLILTFILGILFLGFEVYEFTELYTEGNTPQKSAFLSSYFTLIGTHGLHIFAGLIWAAIMLVQVMRLGITLETFRRLVIFNLFWHFLDLVWIFIFTFVYLIGVI